MNTNWISRMTMAVRRRSDAMRAPSFQLGRADEAWNVDSDSRRLRHELDAMRSRSDGQLAG